VSSDYYSNGSTIKV